MHFSHPIPQGIHDELERLWLCSINRVPATGKIHIVSGVGETVKIFVVDPLKGQARAESPALGGVVVDDIKNHFNTGAV